MTEVELVRYRIEPGETERLREWTEGMRSRRDEAIESLRDEGVFTEAAFLERGEDGDYAVFFVEAEDLERAHEAFSSSTRDVDEEFGDLLAEVVAEEQPEREVEPLYHLVNPERPRDPE